MRKNQKILKLFLNYFPVFNNFHKIANALKMLLLLPSLLLVWVSTCIHILWSRLEWDNLATLGHCFKASLINCGYKQTREVHWPVGTRLMTRKTTIRQTLLTTPPRSELILALEFKTLSLVKNPIIINLILSVHCRTSLIPTALFRFISSPNKASFGTYVEHSDLIRVADSSKLCWTKYCEQIESLRNFDINNATLFNMHRAKVSIYRKSFGNSSITSIGKSCAYGR